MDMTDELVDAEKTLLKYQEKANVVGYDSGWYSFEHIRRVLLVIEQVIFGWWFMKIVLSTSWVRIKELFYL